MCLVLGLKFDSVVANTMHAELSSYIVDGTRDGVVIKSGWGCLGKEMKL
jgi:hypothetical protein